MYVIDENMATGTHFGTTSDIEANGGVGLLQEISAIMPKNSIGITKLPESLEVKIKKKTLRVVF